ncbi:hypothetical protein BGZ92_006367 [Podila epicladia]|nr:hypothetical protein BGZ92_006367 [Podila epicladia]
MLRSILRSLSTHPSFRFMSLPKPTLRSIHDVVPQVRFPAEWEPHERTFMAWPASLHWEDYLGPVRKDIATLAQAIAKYEPVVVLTRPTQLDSAHKALGSSPSIQIVPIPVDDLWTRDSTPVYIKGPKGVTGVDLNFNGWGKKQKNPNDYKLARAMLKQFDLPRIKAPFVSEGGAIETDGQGTLLITESSIVNDNRNPNKTRDQLEQELMTTLGVKKVIWFEGLRGKDITDSHVDCVARFLAPGVVVVSQPFRNKNGDDWTRQYDEVMKVLQTATDARGESLKIVQIPEPNPETYDLGEEGCPSYVNFYVANGAVFVPRFGDEAADKKAQDVLGEYFPGRDIVALDISTIASGGGGIHCSTHDQPK